MSGYMRAGFHRILRRKGRYIALLVIYGLFAVLLYNVSKGSTIYKTADFISQYLGFVVAVFGLVELSFVLAEDIASKTMQIAIGCGISRRKLVLGEWLEMMIYTGLDTLLLVGVICGVCLVNGHAFTGEPLRDISIMFLFRWINAGIGIMFSMMVSFPRQATSLGNLVYLVYAAGFVNLVASTVLTLGPLSKMGLDAWVPDKLIGVAESRMVTGTFSLPQILGIAVYLVLFYQIACILFKKKELEF